MQGISLEIVGVGFYNGKFFELSFAVVKSFDGEEY